MFCSVPGEIPALQTRGEAAFTILLLGPWDPARADPALTSHSPDPRSALQEQTPDFQLGFAPLQGEEWRALESFPGKILPMQTASRGARVEIWVLPTLQGWILWDAPGSLPGAGERREPKAVSRAWSEANVHTQLVGERLEELITGGIIAPRAGERRDPRRSGEGLG